MKPRDLDHLTPAELTAIINAAYKKREDERKFADMLNATQCLTAARCAGNMTRDDFLTFKWQTEEEEEHPEMIESKLKLMAAAGLMTHG